MATYALIHGAGDVGWYWHLVERELRARGHETVAPDLPIEDDDATLADHARVVLDAIEALPNARRSSLSASRAEATSRRSSRSGPARIGSSSWPGWSRSQARPPMRCGRPRAGGCRARRIRALSAFSTTMSTPHWPPKRCRESVANQSRRVGSRGPFRRGRMSRPSSSCAETTDSSPPTGYAAVVRERLHLAPDEIDSGHTPALSHPVELVELMESFRLPARIVR